jgi:hypothetical protein
MNIYQKFFHGLRDYYIDEKIEMPEEFKPKIY